MMNRTKRSLILILIIGAIVAVSVSSFIAIRNRDYETHAQDLLEKGVAAADEYGTDHEGDYRGMTAAILANQYESGVNFADGAGSVINTVYISGLGEDTYILTVRARDGSVFTARKTSSGSVMYNY